MLRADHHRPLVHVVARPADRAPVALEGEVGVAAARHRLLDARRLERRRDRRGRVPARRHERVVEIRGRAVRLHRQDAVAGRRQPVVRRHLERARVLRRDVLVTARVDGLGAFARRPRVRRLLLVRHHSRVVGRPYLGVCSRDEGTVQTVGAAGAGANWPRKPSI